MNFAQECSNDHGLTLSFLLQGQICLFWVFICEEFINSVEDFGEKVKNTVKKEITRTFFFCIRT